MNSSVAQLKESLGVRSQIVSLQAALKAMPKPMAMHDCMYTTFHYFRHRPLLLHLHLHY
jgi:hypothetical protein